MALRKVAPEGIDMYFENVGGMHFEAAMSCLKIGGRVAVCGTISNYNDGKPEPAAIHISNMIYQNQRIEVSFYIINEDSSIENEDSSI